MALTRAHIHQEQILPLPFHALLLVGVLLLAAGHARAELKPEDPTATSASTTPYGANAGASGTLTHDGVSLYYETYGTGMPLLLVHGNGASIGSLAAQIEFFKSQYQVIAMDSRDHGRSGSSDGPLTYEKMTDDLAALIDHLKLGSVNVIGWSDGGIEALLLGIRHPGKVKKIVSMAPNLNPGPSALYKESEEMIKSILASIPDSERDTPAGSRTLKVAGLMLKEPNIDPTELERIMAPTLVLAGDQDMVRTEHIVEIFGHLQNAQLAIFPNSTHMVPFDDPALFNSTIERFLSTPFVKKDRIADMLKSYEKLTAGLPQ
jgi:pimeloyl-ACP methyl ester carboxylesterase